MSDNFFPMFDSAKDPLIAKIDEIVGDRDPEKVPATELIAHIPALAKYEALVGTTAAKVRHHLVRVLARRERNKPQDPGDTVRD